MKSALSALYGVVPSRIQKLRVVSRSMAGCLHATCNLLPIARPVRYSSRSQHPAVTSCAGKVQRELVQTHNFIEDIVAADLMKNAYAGRVVTRFPPEPNGHLHIGHAKSIFLNFGIASKFGGACHLRFDDTNPVHEKQEYIDSIQEDVRWLGVQWHGPVRYASDYFEQLHEWALAMIEHGWAYVDQLSAEYISEYRGTLTEPGRDSPFRERPVSENLELFRQMQSGSMEQGSAVLRAKIDMAHANVVMRDPIMYRIIKDPPHPRTQRRWVIYPTYDWAHGLSDAIEQVTHSVCTLEFNTHNELYDWFNHKVQSIGGLQGMKLPRQHEFARLEMTNILVSKRKLKRLIDEGLIESWNDPRMPTLSGMRRRGYPAIALRQLCELIGVTKVASSVIEYSLLENLVRSALKKLIRIKLLCVLKPLRVVITNWNSDEKIIEGPQEPGLPARPLAMGREILIDEDDFMLEPSNHFKRLAPGRTVKLRYGYTLTCDQVIQDDNGAVVQLQCSYDPSSLGLRPPKGVAVIHWVSAIASTPVHVRLYDELFKKAIPKDSNDFMLGLNPGSLKILEGAQCESSVTDLCCVGGDKELEQVGVHFERCGYFVIDRAETIKSLEAGGPLVFNRTVTLNDSTKEKTTPRGANRRQNRS